MNKKILLATILAILFAGYSPEIYAQTAPSAPSCTGLICCGGAGQSSCTICDLFYLVNEIIKKIISVFVPIVAGLVIAIAGFMMIINRDKADVLNKGKEIILMTIIGVVLIYGAYGIVYSVFYGMGYVKGDPLNFNLTCT